MILTNTNSDILYTSPSTPLDLLSILLTNRGITDFQAFLKPPFPQSPIDTTSAINLIKSFSGQKILIYGDYDVDGLTSSTIIYQAFLKLGFNVTCHIPHRHQDGYGFKYSVFQRICSDQTPSLLITVDNGIVAQSEFALLKSQYPNIKILVIDHHQKEIDPPSADVVFHSTATSAAGLAFFIANALGDNSNLGLSALGVVADCVPLIGVNRSIVFHGLPELSLNPPLPIKKILSSAGINSRPLTTYDLSFIIAPRLNSIGRLDDSALGFELLNSSDLDRIDQLVASINLTNQGRQDIQQSDFIDADQQVNPDSLLLFASSDRYNPGIIGLMASRLTEKYYLPSIIVSIENGVARGSCRSIPEFNIIEYLKSHHDLFIDLGGHPMAAGFTIDTSNLPILQKQLTQDIHVFFNNQRPVKSTQYDCLMDLSAVTLTNYAAISKLAPFGFGNTTPQFLFTNQKINSVFVMGKNKDHLKLRVGSKNIDILAFKQGNLAEKIHSGDTLNFIASLDLNTFNGQKNIQLILKEIN